MNNENQYLTMANELKEQYDELVKDRKKIIEDLLFFKKEFITTYGVIRLLDIDLSSEFVLNNSIVQIIENLRSHLSKIFESKILMIEDDENDDDDDNESNDDVNIEIAFSTAVS